MPLVHVWFATKRRNWLLQGDVLEAAREELARAAGIHGIKLLEYEAVVDHVHLLLDLTSVQDLPKSMNLLKGSSARRIFQRFPELKLDAGVKSLWQAGYGHKLITAESEQAVRRYIRTQWNRLEKYER